MVEPDNWSAIGRLLEGVSWEGASVRKYRAGGRGLENVLTTQVLQLLDYLPRPVFLADVFRRAHGADAVREAVAAQAEELRLTVLPDELSLPPRRVVVQPDAIAETDRVYVLVEAKRIRSSSFQPEQLGREYLGLVRQAEQRRPLLLLILGEEPPVFVQGHGRMSISEAVEDQLRRVASNVDYSRGDVEELGGRIGERVAWTTWKEIGAMA